MAFLWDYSKKDIEKTSQGRILLLERMVNYGPEKNEKINLKEVKKYWSKLNLFPKNKKLMKYLIWGKTQS